MHQVVARRRPHIRKRSPRTIQNTNPKNQQTAREVCCEPFKDVPQLGRLTLRDEGKTIAIGKITRVSKAATK